MDLRAPDLDQLCILGRQELVVLPVQLDACLVAYTEVVGSVALDRKLLPVAGDDGGQRGRRCACPLLRRRGSRCVRGQHILLDEIHTFALVTTISCYNHNNAFVKSRVEKDTFREAAINRRAHFLL